MKTPMSSDTKLMKDEECESVDSTKNRGMIGSLLYLTASRPDVMFIVCLCARFQEALKTSHLEAEIMWTERALAFVECCLTSWFSKKQTALAISTTEAEYVSAGKACQQALWMKQALIDYDVRLDDVLIMSERYNLAYFIVAKQPRLIMPYDMLLTHLFKHVMAIGHRVLDDYYDLHDRVMYPLTAQQTRKDYDTKRGRHSTSSSQR
ncbi:hypothetical protein Tco_1105251 [Tanacetum coccineum]